MSWGFPVAGYLGVLSPDEPQFLHTVGSPDPVRQIAHMHGLGFAAVLDNRLKQRPVETQQRMGAALREHGMRMGGFVHATARPGQPRSLPWTRRDEAARRLLREEMDASVATGGRVGGGTLVVTSLEEEGRALDSQLDDFALNLRELLPLAEDAGLRVGVESVCRERLAGVVLRHTSDCLALIGRVARPSLGVIFDTYHVAIEDGDLLAAFRAAAPHVFSIQLADVPDRIAPGEGSLDMAGLLQASRTLGARQPLIELEFSPRRQDAQAEADALHAFRRIAAQAGA